ncbi:hypothetical protein DFAR_3800015 [Desulfarculales bacterium]
MARVFLASPTWTEVVSQFGIDIWMTTLAVNNNVPICQAYMGRLNIHKPKDPASELGPMFSQVVALFSTRDPSPLVTGYASSGPRPPPSTA